MVVGGWGSGPLEPWRAKGLVGKGRVKGCVCVGWVDVGAACRVAGSAAAAGADGDSSLLIL